MLDLQRIHRSIAAQFGPAGPVSSADARSCCFGFI